MKAIFTPTSGVIRVFANDDAKYGEKYIIDLHGTLYDHGRVIYIEGLTERITHAAVKAIGAELRRIGVKYARWSHTNNRGHEVSVCVDVNTSRLKLE